MSDNEHECGGRKRLPDRRLSETRPVTHKADGHEVQFTVTIGYLLEQPLEPKEIFYDSGLKSGADLEWVARDAAVALSLLLQSGMGAAYIVDALSFRETAAGELVPGSVMATMARELCTPPQWANAIREQTGKGDGIAAE